MLFNSIQFLIFFPIVLLIYFIIPNKVKHLWLLASSYYFYMCWNAKYALLILISTIVTYLSGLFLEKVRLLVRDDAARTRRMNSIVAASFLLNLSILFFFKYYNFTMDLINRLFAHIGVRFIIPGFDVLLPVGISFYTFQALSYTMDVYRGEIGAEKDFFRYALFVSFFPQLVAGPIERSKNLLDQLAVPHRLTVDNLREGTLLMIWGYFLKLVIADRIAVFVDTVYADYDLYPGYYIIVATVLFAFQIYCDFAGYSTIAMGTARILDIQLMENFDAPYLSVSVADFWRKWHISLTSWFKDYLYIPLGGSRRGKIRKYFNKLIVFLVSGLWHGASVSFIVWGGLNGLYQIAGEILTPLRNRGKKILQITTGSLGDRIFHIIMTFILIDFSWIFFRADGISTALNMIKQMVTVYNPWILFDGSLYNCGLESSEFSLVIAALSVLLFADYLKLKGVKIRQVIAAQDWWFRYCFIAFSILAVMIFGKYGPSYDSANFIYFQF